MDASLLADLSRRLESLIRTGTIAAVDLPAVRVRVRSGGLLTRELLRHHRIAEHIGISARQRALERYGIDRFVSDWNAALKRVTE